MSNFSEKHPKLAAAFNGAKNSFKGKRIPYLIGGVSAGGTIAAVAFAAAPLLPFAAAAAAGGIVLGTTVNGTKGAYKALKDYNKNTPPKPQ